MNHHTLHRQCGCKKDCGCNDSFLASAPFCGTPPECTSQNCSETFPSDCIYWSGDSIADLGIIKGAKLTDVVQILINAIVNPGCTFPTAPCLSVVGFGSTTINPTTVGLTWTPIIGADSYQVHYKLVGASTWILNPSTTNSYDTIGGLTPNTQYYIMVTTSCGANACNSLTLLITTKTN